MSDQSLSILHVIASLAPRYGGPVKVAELCEALAERGNHVEVAATNIDGPLRLDVPIGMAVERNGFRVIHYGVWTSGRWVYSPGLAGWLRGNVTRFDVAHIHGLYMFQTSAAAFVCRRAHVPYIMQPHGVLTRYHRRHNRLVKSIYDRVLEGRNLRHAAGIRWDSQSEHEQGDEIGLDTRAFVIPPGIDIPALDEYIPRVPQRVLYLGRLSEKKGVEILLAAFGLLKHTHPLATLWIVGPDDESMTDRLAAQAQELGVADRVTFRGLVVGPEKTKLLREASVFALPSADESFGATAFEALAAETPVVVTEGVADHGKISAARAGLVVKRSAADIAAALATVLADGETARRMGANGRALVEAEYSWGSVASRVEDMYRTVVADGLRNAE